MTLHEFIAAFEEIVMVQSGTVNLETQLDTLDDWDSLSRASLLTTCEEELDLKIDESILRKVTFFSEIVDLVDEKLVK